MTSPETELELCQPKLTKRKTLKKQRLDGEDY